MEEDKNSERIFYKDECPVCKNEFHFSEKNVKESYEPITSQNGIKKFLGMNEGYNIYRYIQCPFCKNYFKLKFTIDRSVIDGKSKY